MDRKGPYTSLTSPSPLRAPLSQSFLPLTSPSLTAPPSQAVWGTGEVLQPHSLGSSPVWPALASASGGQWWSQPCPGALGAQERRHCLTTVHSQGAVGWSLEWPGCWVGQGRGATGSARWEQRSLGEGPRPAWSPAGPGPGSGLSVLSPRVSLGAGSPAGACRLGLAWPGPSPWLWPARGWPGCCVTWGSAASHACPPCVSGFRSYGRTARAEPVSRSEVGAREGAAVLSFA